MLPSRWRPADKKTVFHAVLWPIGQNQHILVLPPERWNLMLAKLRTRSLTDQGVRSLERVIGSSSAELVMDGVGRICLPEKMAATAGIEDEAQFVGLLDKFEIWSPARYQASTAQDIETAAALAKEIDL